MKKLLTLGSISLILLIPEVLAHCPLCTAAAGAGIGIARFYGLDDAIIGLFLGAFIVSMGLWFNNWLKKKINIPFQTFLIIFASFLLTAIPLYLAGIMTNFYIVKSAPQVSMLGLHIFGIDKLLFGTIVGILAVWSSFSTSDYIKKKRGKVLWNYQGLSFMLIALIILTEIFFILTR